MKDWQEQKFWSQSVCSIEDIRRRDPQTGLPFDIDSDSKFHQHTSPSPEDILIGEETEIELMYNIAKATVLAQCTTSARAYLETHERFHMMDLTDISKGSGKNGGYTKDDVVTYAAQFSGSPKSIELTPELQNMLQERLDTNLSQNMNDLLFNAVRWQCIEVKSQWKDAIAPTLNASLAMLEIIGYETEDMHIIDTNGEWRDRSDDKLNVFQNQYEKFVESGEHITRRMSENEVLIDAGFVESTSQDDRYQEVKSNFLEWQENVRNKERQKQVADDAKRAARRANRPSLSGAA